MNGFEIRLPGRRPPQKALDYATKLRSVDERAYASNYLAWLMGATKTQPRVPDAVHLDIADDIETRLRQIVRVG
jgi:hypothetical protein